VKRVLEILPPAPPLPPRQQTEAELAKEAEKDVQAREMMIISFTGLVQDFMRKFRKVTATVRVCPILASILSYPFTLLPPFFPPSPLPNYFLLHVFSTLISGVKNELISRKRLWS
jgi:hypothetical protein